MAFVMLNMWANLNEEFSYVSLQTLSPNPQAILLFLSLENRPCLVHNAPLFKSISLLLNEQVKNPISKRMEGQD
jgi:hypothetical protein